MAKATVAIGDVVLVADTSRGAAHERRYALGNKVAKLEAVLAAAGEKEADAARVALDAAKAELESAAGEVAEPKPIDRPALVEAVHADGSIAATVYRGPRGPHFVARIEPGTGPRQFRPR